MTTKADILQELGVSDDAETVLTEPETGGLARIALIHQTGHVYSEAAGREPQVICRLLVERLGQDETIVRAELHIAGLPARECDTPGCQGTAGAPYSIAPATNIRICRACARRMAE